MPPPNVFEALCNISVFRIDPFSVLGKKKIEPPSLSQEQLLKTELEIIPSLIEEEQTVLLTNKLQSLIPPPP